MNILEELWLGNIDPQGWSIRREDPKMKQALALIVEDEKAMRDMLSNTQKEQLEKMCDRQSDLTDLLEQRAFAEGFRLAVRLMVDVMNTVEVPLADS